MLGCLFFKKFKKLNESCSLSKAARMVDDRFLLDCWNDVRFHVFSFCTAKMFHHKFASTT